MSRCWAKDLSLYISQSLFWLTGRPEHPLILTTKSASWSPKLQQHSSKQCVGVRHWAQCLTCAIPQSTLLLLTTLIKLFFQMWKWKHRDTKCPQINMQFCFILQSAFLVTRADLPSLMILREWLKDFTFESPYNQLTKLTTQPKIFIQRHFQSFSRMLGPASFAASRVISLHLWAPWFQELPKGLWVLLASP